MEELFIVIIINNMFNYLLDIEQNDTNYKWKWNKINLNEQKTIIV